MSTSGLRSMALKIISGVVLFLTANFCYGQSIGIAEVQRGGRYWYTTGDAFPIITAAAAFSTYSLPPGASGEATVFVCKHQIYIDQLKMLELDDYKSLAFGDSAAIPFALWFSTIPYCPPYYFEYRAKVGYVEHLAPGQYGPANVVWTDETSGNMYYCY